MKDLFLSRSSINILILFFFYWSPRVHLFSSYLVFLLNVLLPRAAAAAAKSLQSCPTLCDPIEGSPAGSAVPGILLERTLEWTAISFSNA